MKHEESIQTIKIEKTTPKTSLNNNIKERLNLHVKRRLQLDAEHIVNNVDEANETVAVNEAVDHNKEKHTEPPRTRRPYTRRVDKIKRDIISTDGRLPRKNKRHKMKQIRNTQTSAVAMDLGKEDMANRSTLSGGIGEDDYSHDGTRETEMKIACNRDKDKCPDILGMVLSIKKRELLLDPTVQALLNEIMSVIRK